MYNHAFWYAVALIGVPTVVGAQTVTSMLNAFSKSLSGVAGLLLSVAVLVFAWGVVQFIAHAGDEKLREAGRQKIIWGIVGLAFIVSLWGVVNLFRVMTGVSSTSECASPRVVIGGGGVETYVCD